METNVFSCITELKPTFWGRCCLVFFPYVVSASVESLVTKLWNYMLLILFNISCPFLDFAQKFGENHGSCQAGISSFYIEVCIKDTKCLSVYIFTFMYNIYIYKRACKC